MQLHLSIQVVVVACDMFIEVLRPIEVPALNISHVTLAGIGIGKCLRCGKDIKHVIDLLIS